MANSPVSQAQKHRTPHGAGFVLELKRFNCPGPGGVDMGKLKRFNFLFKPVKRGGCS